LKRKGPLNYLSGPRLLYLNQKSYIAQQTAEVRLNLLVGGFWRHTLAAPH
jgi:hypothetical protein